MKSNKTNGFSITEMMIVITIIGLMAAILIPAFHSVKISETAKRAASGEPLTESQAEYLRDNASSIPADIARKLPKELGGTKDTIYTAPTTIRFDRTIILDGKTYGLVPLN